MPAVRSVVLSVAFAAAFPLTATPAAAQRFPFSRTFTVADGAALDASTIRGRIDVSAGAPGRVEVEGTVTVRVAGPADALDIAQRLATNPPVEQDGATVRLRAPMSAVERRAVTVAYVVRVPAGMPVQVSSESGALRVAGVGGGAAIRTQSGTIDVLALAGPASVETGSGAVHADGVAGLLTVSTQSGGITAGGLRSGVTVSTQSGAVGLAMTGTGAATVATQSGGITVAGLRGGLTATTQSGRVMVDGAPAAPWTITTGSGSVELALARGAALELDLETQSGSVVAQDAAFAGTFGKRHVTARAGGGGPLVHVRTRSGSIRAALAGGR